MKISRARRNRIILFALLAVAVVVLIAVVAILAPILTHKSAGGSGQALPIDYVSEVSATGADGRTRSLEVTETSGESFDPASVRPGESLTVTGSGFDAAIGIYVAICAIPSDPSVKPGPCLGGIPEGATEESADTSKFSSVWISDDWAWRAFATQGYNDPKTGSFTTSLLVPAAQTEGLDCTVTRCAITTRADHTAVNDRVQDLLIPISFAK
ncbi:hypothetical protein JOF28_002403 [Leucobacter exalbidus]|uniref:Uncharacterized protein n=1 Tax=Leucobacter exalbidus TaxID=662960 RepID=A0A940PY12_9MICO|nr:hypothetical protein [Leucobacter exalbidus]MBP1327171.1 hypothetical protein [Leucobacter exalbidus]